MMDHRRLFVGNQAYNTNAGEAGRIQRHRLRFAGSLDDFLGRTDFWRYTPSSVFTVDQKLVTPRYGSYNFNIESQVTSKVALQIGYVDHKDAISSASAISISSIMCWPRRQLRKRHDDHLRQPVLPVLLDGSFINTPLYYVNQIETSALPTTIRCKRR